MQFGEGNFLRAFLDWILQNCNDREITNSGVVVVQPMPTGRVNNLAEQDGLYTVCLEGMDNGVPKKTRQIVDVLQDFINPYEQYDKFLDYAHSPELQVIVSNTTEAGIALDKTDVDFSVCPKSFPGKLLAFLYERYNYFNGSKASGLAFVPCELIDNNGEKKLIDNAININHKDDWSCPNCNNINYAFRLVCNRCQMSKEDLIQAGLFEKID